jgi:WD40 repeat protein
MDQFPAQPIVLRGQERRLSTIAFSPGGRWFAAAGKDGVNRDHRLYLWDREDLSRTPITLREKDQGVDAVMFSPDDRWLAAASDRVRLWQVAAPEVDPVVLSDTQAPIAFSRQGGLLGAADADNTVLVWNTGDLRAAPVRLQEHQSAITALAFSPDNRWLATGGYDDHIRLWTVENFGAKPLMLQVDVDGVNALAFSPDGKWLVAAGVMARLWQLEHLDEPPILFAGHDPIATSITFSPDGRWLFTAGWDGVIRLWQVAGETVTLANLPGNTGFLGPAAFANSSAGFGGPVAAFSPDGRLFAVIDDNNVSMWRLDNLDHDPVILPGNSQTSAAIAFDALGRWLALAGVDGASRLWLHQADDLTDLACATAGRNLDSTEWQRYFPGEEYRSTCPQWPEGA